MHKGFTLIELIVIMIVVGILASFAVPQFIVTKERALDREARSILSLIQAAEKICKMETAAYYPAAGSTSDIDAINTNLRLSLPAASASSSWNYTIDSDAQQATAVRNKAGGRSHSIPFTSDTITCTDGASDLCL